MGMIWIGLALIGIGIVIGICTDRDDNSFTAVIIVLTMIVGLATLIAFGLSIAQLDTDGYEDACLTTQKYQYIVDNTLEAMKDNPYIYIAQFTEIDNWNTHILEERKCHNSWFWGRLYEDWWDDVPLVEININ